MNNKKRNIDSMKLLEKYIVEIEGIYLSLLGLVF